MFVKELKAMCFSVGKKVVDVILRPFFVVIVTD